jgi:hypothetical protein
MGEGGRGGDANGGGLEQWRHAAGDERKGWHVGLADRME